MNGKLNITRYLRKALAVKKKRKEREKERDQNKQRKLGGGDARAGTRKKI